MRRQLPPDMARQTDKPGTPAHTAAFPPPLPSPSQSYSRDTFMFISLAILAATGGYSTHNCKPSLLNRDQTEEWKGWMQILFLLYHYFEAKEMYNAIRIFIAAYVWMTGFGNFSYYYIRQDFSLGRFCQMMWRLNFFVFFCCVALRNSYVLYYICPMHTLFTIMLYCAPAAAPLSGPCCSSHVAATSGVPCFCDRMRGFGSIRPQWC